MSDARLACRGVTRSFGATRALDGVDLDAAAGEVHAVLGENGAGKSTLMKILAGAEVPDRGAITIDGAPYRPRSPAAGRDAGVVLVSQERALCPHLSVAENVLLGQEPSRAGVLQRGRAEGLVRDALRDASAERIAPDARAGNLPIADQQLIEIARALVPWRGRGRAKVLILDEPTSSLGREDAARLFDLVRRLKGEGMTVLYVSHFLEEVSAVCDRYTVLRDGATVAHGRIADVSHEELVERMAGRRVEQLFARSPRTPGAPVLQVTDLAAAPRLVGATFELRRGEILGIAGLVGAGRSELLRAIFGLLPVTRGEIRVAAIPSTVATPAVRLAAGVGMLSEDRQAEGLGLGLSIADNVTLSKLPLRVSPRAQAAAASRFIGNLAIRCQGPAQRVRELSGGNQQKVALARLLHHDVDVLLLDEPTRGVDVGAKAQIFAVIDALACAGKAVLLVSSWLPELLGVCDRIAVMCRGRLGEARPASEWTEELLLEQATGARRAEAS